MAFFVLIVLLTTQSVFAVETESPSRIIPEESTAYIMLDSLFIEQGLALPSQARPYTRDELSLALARLNTNLLSSAGRAAYDSLKALLRGGDRYAEADGLKLRAALVVSPELYAANDMSSSFWEYGAWRRLPLLSIPLGMTVLDLVDARLNLDLRKEPFLTGGDWINFTNVMHKPTQIDLNMPYRASISVGRSHWDALVGRELLGWGAGRSGNLMLGDHLDYHDAVRLNTWWDWFKYTFLVLGLDPWILVDNGANMRPVDDQGGTLPIERFKMFMAHRFEFRLGDSVQLALSEAIVFGGKTPDIRLFNPLMIYHNLYIKEWANSLLALEADWTPLPGLNLYGQVALDQFSTAVEQSSYGLDREPNALGYLAGCTTVWSMGSGFLQLNLEGVYTDPWLYIREHSLVSFVSVRRRQSESRQVITGLGNFWFDRQPLGYALGPDVIVGRVALGYMIPGGWRLDLKYRIIFQGQNRITSSMAGVDAWTFKTPTGTAAIRNIASVRYETPLSPSMDVGLEPAFIHTINKDHVSGSNGAEVQLAAWCRYVF